MFSSSSFSLLVQYKIHKVLNFFNFFRLVLGKKTIPLVYPPEIFLTALSVKIRVLRAYINLVKYWQRDWPLGKDWNSETKRNLLKNSPEAERLCLEERGLYEWLTGDLRQHLKARFRNNKLFYGNIVGRSLLVLWICNPLRNHSVTWPIL